VAAFFTDCREPTNGEVLHIQFRTPIFEIQEKIAKDAIFEKGAGCVPYVHGVFYTTLKTCKRSLCTGSHTILNLNVAACRYHLLEPMIYSMLHRPHNLWLASRCISSRDARHRFVQAVQHLSRVLNMMDSRPLTGLLGKTLRGYGKPVQV